MTKLRTCRECFEEFVNGPTTPDDGFCSDPCAKQYDRDIVGHHYGDGDGGEG